MFDKYIKDRLHDSKSPVPEGLWEKIVAEKDKKRPFGFISRTVLVALVAALAVAGSYVGYKTINNKNNKQALINNTDQNNKQQVIKAENNTGLQTDKNESGDDGIIGQSNKNNNNTEESKNDVVTSNNATSQKNNKKIKAAHLDIHRLIANKISIKSNKQLYSKENKAQLNSNVPSPKINTSAILIDEDNSINNLLVEAKTSYKKINANAIALKAGLQKPLTPNASNTLSARIDCPSSEMPQRNDFYVEAYAAPDYSFKNYENKSLPQQFGHLKDSTETQRLGFTAGIRLSKSLSNHLLIKGGLQFSQINERFNLRNENERRITTVITIRQVVLSPGDTVFVSDTSTVTQIGYRVTTNTNTYRSIDLPILLTYDFGNGNLKYALTGGAIFNLKSWSSGNIIDTGYNATAFNKQNRVYKTHLGISLYAGLSIIKNISPRLDFFAEPYFRYSLRNMARSDAGFKQKFSTAGVLFGLRYNLKSNKQQ